MKKKEVIDNLVLLGISLGIIGMSLCLFWAVKDAPYPNINLFIGLTLFSTGWLSVVASVLVSTFWKERKDEDTKTEKPKEKSNEELYEEQKQRELKDRI